MATKTINSEHLNLRLPPELIELLKATEEPITVYARDVLMAHFNISEQTIKATRRANK